MVGPFGDEFNVVVGQRFRVGGIVKIVFQFRLVPAVESVLRPNPYDSCMIAEDALHSGMCQSLVKREWHVRADTE